MKDEKSFSLQALVCEREAMVAENMQRQYLNQPMAYTEIDFMLLSEKILNEFKKSCEPSTKYILILEDHVPVKLVDSMNKYREHDSRGKEKTWLSFELNKD